MNDVVASLLRLGNKDFITVPVNNIIVAANIIILSKWVNTTCLRHGLKRNRRNPQTYILMIMSMIVKYLGATYDRPKSVIKYRL